VTQLVEFSVGEGTDAVVVFEVDAVEVPDDAAARAPRDSGTVAHRPPGAGRSTTITRPGTRRVVRRTRTRSPSR
jgi:hypothetical protein